MVNALPLCYALSYVLILLCSPSQSSSLPTLGAAEFRLDPPAADLRPPAPNFRLIFGWGVAALLDAGRADTAP